MKKTRHAEGMAGEQNDYVRVRIPTALKTSFEEACAARSQAMSKVVRHLLEAYCKSSDAGDPLIAPLSIHGGSKAKRK